MPNGSKTVIGSVKNGLPVIVKDDVAKLPDRQSFAGSTATTIRLFKTALNALNGDVLAVSKTMSSTPARVMNLTDRGVIAPNYRADLLILNNNYDIVKVIASGEEVSVPCGKT